MGVCGRASPSSGRFHRRSARHCAIQPPVVRSIGQGSSISAGVRGDEGAPMLRKLCELTGFVLLIWAGLDSCSSGTDGVTDPQPPGPFWDLVRTIDGLQSDAFPRIAVDRGASIYIAGTSYGHQAFLAKHDADGNLVWVRNFSGAG